MVDDDGNEIVKLRGIVRHRLQRPDQAGAAAQAVKQKMSVRWISTSASSTALLQKPVLKHSLGQTAAPLGRQGARQTRPEIRGRTAAPAHPQGSRNCGKTSSGSPWRRALYVRDRDARERFSPSCTPKACANELRERRARLSFLMWYIFASSALYFTGLLYHKNDSVYNRGNQNLRECFT